jgi:hypothetical protein
MRCAFFVVSLRPWRKRRFALKGSRVLFQKLESTHKSSNGNNFATPPRTMNTATAKFTMRLRKHKSAFRNPLPSFHVGGNSQDIGEVHGGRIGEVWEPQLDGGRARWRVVWESSSKLEEMWLLSGGVDELVGRDV